jgi:hypothetical protein
VERGRNAKEPVLLQLRLLRQLWRALRVLLLLLLLLLLLEEAGLRGHRRR